MRAGLRAHWGGTRWPQGQVWEQPETSHLEWAPTTLTEAWRVAQGLCPQSWLRAGPALALPAPACLLQPGRSAGSPQGKAALCKPQCNRLISPQGDPLLSLCDSVCLGEGHSEQGADGVTSSEAWNTSGSEQEKVT